MRVKQLIFFGILLISLFIINGMVHSISTLQQKNELLVHAQQVLEKEKQTNKHLKKQLTVISKPEFVEGEARNKLFLAKPGEEVIVLSHEQEALGKQQKKKPVEIRPAWQQWLELFF